MSEKRFGLKTRNEFKRKRKVKVQPEQPTKRLNKSKLENNKYNKFNNLSNKDSYLILLILD